MDRAPRAIRAILLAAATLLVAAAGDIAVELLADSGVFGQRYVDVAHEAVGPPLVVGIALVVALVACAWADRRAGGRRRVRASGVTLRAARELARRSPLADSGGVAACAAAIAVAVEGVEQLAGGASPFGGLPLSCASVVCAAVLFFGLAFAAVTALQHALHGLVRTLESIARSLAAAIALATAPRRRARVSRCDPRGTRPAPERAAGQAARCFADRAPPRLPLPAR